MRTITQAERLLQHYPDPTCWDLRQALAAYWQRAADEFLIGNGSTELIHLLPRALQIRHLLVVGPTFSEYAAAMKRCGGHVSMVMADRAEGYRPPLERVFAPAHGFPQTVTGRPPIDAVLLCNPNSPTGYACDAAAVRRLARQAGRLRLWCIIDETFAEYCHEVSILSQALPERTIVLRSFHEIFWTARPSRRVRGGELARHRQDRGTPTSLVCEYAGSTSCGSRIARCAACPPKPSIHGARADASDEGTHSAAGLYRVFFCGEFYPDGTTGRAEGGRDGGRIRRQGILIRDCSQVPGLNARSVRVAVRTRADNDRLLHALAAVIRQGGS